MFNDLANFMLHFLLILNSNSHTERAVSVLSENKTNKRVDDTTESIIIAKTFFKKVVKYSDFEPNNEYFKLYDKIRHKLYSNIC